MSIFTVPSVLVGARALNDKGMSLNFHTREMSSEEKATVLDFQGNEGYLLFSSNQLNESDIPKGDADARQKSPSQRLYAVLFVYWKQLGEPGDFDSFRKSQMDTVINEFKSKLV